MTSEAFENPFEDLHPVYRSEEDDIRKGVFSTALRALATSSLEERRKWCAAIRLTQQPASSANRNGASGDRAGSKRVKQKEGATEEPLLNDRKRSRSPEAPLTAAPAEGASAGVSTALPPEAGFTLAEAGECIGTFMRAMLDRVLGLSLENLSVPQLKVLCMMVGIPETASRSKSAVYSHLAAFYFTHCEKLGKRVSRSTHMEQQVREEAARLLRATRDTAKAGAPKSKIDKKEEAPPPKKAAAREKKEMARKEEVEREAVAKEKKKLAASKTKVAAVATKPKPAAPTAATATLHHKGTFTSSLPANIFAGGNSNSNFGFESDEEEDEVSVERDAAPSDGDQQDDGDRDADSTNAPENDDESDEVSLHVEHNANIFQKKDSHKRALAGGSSSGGSSGAAASAESDAWGPVMLEKRIASIVHLYDPVTTSIVVKKLAQAGYRGGDAQQVVERTLQKFHDRQFIFYDNGIAYLM